MIRTADFFEDPSFTNKQNQMLLYQMKKDIENAGCRIFASKQIEQAQTKMKGVQLTFEFDMNKSLNKKKGSLI